VSAAQVRAYAGKADEYLAAAASELEAGRSITATSLAIHAAINAADAVTGDEWADEQLAKTTMTRCRCYATRARTVPRWRRSSPDSCH